MNKLGNSIIDVYRMAIAGGIVFVTWKCVRHWHSGFAEKIGHTIDTSITTAANKLEKTAKVMGQWAESGLGESLGKELDEILIDTKMALESATDLVLSSLNRIK